MTADERKQIILETLRPFERMFREHATMREAEAAQELKGKGRRAAYIRASEVGEIQAKTRKLLAYLLVKEGLIDEEKEG